MVKYRGDHVGTDFRTVWQLGLGKLDALNSGGTVDILPAHTTFRLDDDKTVTYSQPRAWVMMLISNTPQAMFSAMYLFINSKITAMASLRDWTSLALRRQPLRVSNPIPGTDQVSTYWLSLPYKYSLALMAASTLMNWFLSQSLFFYRYKVFDEDGRPWQHENPLVSWSVNKQLSAGLGYSALGIVCAMALGGLILAALLVLSFQRCAPGLPLGSSNSLVISAACHAPKTDTHAAEKLVTWGSVGGENGESAHCTITSQEAGVPQSGLFYA